MYVEYIAILNRKTKLQIWTNATIFELDMAKQQIINKEALKLGVKEKGTVSVKSTTIIPKIPAQLEENGYKVSYEQPENNGDYVRTLTTQEVYPEETQIFFTPDS